jgi:chemosensory pili system protein ChpA (sensor histidine kinase/response regulator)
MPDHVQVFIQAAEDIRRLLHQFAAGFLKEPDEAVLAALRAISETEFAALPADVADSLYAEQPPESEIPDESGFEPDAGIQLVEAETEVQAPDTELSDALDVDLFPVFEEETLELLPQLGGALRQWAARPDNLGARNEALRVLHTLKGSARLAGAMRLGEMSHRLESAIEQLGAKIFQPQELELLLTRFDQIQANFEQLRITPQAALSLPETSQLPEEPELQTQPGPAEQPAIGVVAPVVTPSLPATVVSAFTPLAPLRQLTSQTVRVRSQLLDRMVNQAGEVMITRSRLEARLVQLRASLGELTGNLDRLRSQLRDIELQSESQMQSRLAQVKDSAQAFDPLEFDRFTRVQELTRMMAESVHDVATVQRNLQRTAEGTEDDLIAQGRQARELQRDLLRTRMVEFEGISERLFGVVRQAAKDSGKQVRLEIKGGSLDMDRGVLERMAPVFEHLLRNAVAHGIEDPQARVAAAKPVVGAISIHLYQQSNDVTVEFSDDGAGLNLAQIRKQAVADGSVSADELLTDAQATQLIFKPGFSTAAEVTELAGRGIGLDVVRAEVNALGGRVETTTEHGQGTKFKLVLPLTTAVTQVVMLRIGEMSIGVPANLVEMVRRVPAADLARAYQDNVYEFNGESVPFFWAGALLQASAHNREPNTKSSAVAVFRSAGQRLAMHVSEVLGNQEVVVKNLGPQLSRLPGLVGMSVLASGAVVLIYNPVALTSVYGQMARQLSSQTEQDRRSSPVLLDSISQTPMVLVVDDSITVRRVTQRLLKREGFRVVLAADGLQALEKLREEKPVVVLSDIEMPRMDGFDLARTIRADAKLCDIPIIMITSRIAEKHRDHARELGVDHYLGKPYSEDELIGLVRQYCAVPAETTP